MNKHFFRKYYKNLHVFFFFFFLIYSYTKILKNYLLLSYSQKIKYSFSHLNITQTSLSCSLQPLSLIHTVCALAYTYNTYASRSILSRSFSSSRDRCRRHGPPDFIYSPRAGRAAALFSLSLTLTSARELCLYIFVRTAALHAESSANSLPRIGTREERRANRWREYAAVAVIKEKVDALYCVNIWI